MKRITSLIIASLLVLTLLLTSCSGSASSAGAKLDDSSETLVVIEATATDGSLEDALKALSDAGELTFGGADGDYGFYLTSVNGREADASAGEYWAIYTTLGEYDSVAYSNAEYGTYTYNGKALASASYGISGLPLVEGELYAIVLIESY